MQRILVIGSPGAGKSTVAGRISELTGLPVVHLDQLFWEPGWKLRKREDYLRLVEAAIEEESWIIDGNCVPTLSKRLQRADAVLFLDLPTRICLWRVLKRIFTGYGVTRPDMADDCPERFDWEFLLYVIRFRNAMRPKVAAILAEHQYAKLTRATCHDEVERWIAQIDP